MRTGLSNTTPEQFAKHRAKLLASNQEKLLGSRERSKGKIGTTAKNNLIAEIDGLLSLPENDSQNARIDALAKRLLGCKSQGPKKLPCRKRANHPPPSKDESLVTWSYGVVTVGARINELLPRTLASLYEGGFDSPRLFVDGCEDPSVYDRFNLPKTIHEPRITHFRNWSLALAEMYFRDPNCTYYAIFEDDLVAVRNLRSYLEQCARPIRAYWNLYTFPVNQRLACRCR